MLLRSTYSPNRFFLPLSAAQFQTTSTDWDASRVLSIWGFACTSHWVKTLEQTQILLKGLCILNNLWSSRKTWNISLRSLLLDLLPYDQAMYNQQAWMVWLMDGWSCLGKILMDHFRIQLHARRKYHPNIMLLAWWTFNPGMRAFWPVLLKILDNQPWIYTSCDYPPVRRAAHINVIRFHPDLHCVRPEVLWEACAGNTKSCKKASNKCGSQTK